MRTAPAGRWRDDRGSASLWVLAVGALVVSVALAVALSGAAMTARHRAQVSADLGALAGARHAAEGAQGACARAEMIVARNGTVLVGCRLDGLDLVVDVTASWLLPGLGAARASARAGPVRAPP
jgi:secretion/DNA translocation related TadE-like protein